VETEKKITKKIFIDGIYTDWCVGVKKNGQGHPFRNPEVPNICPKTNLLWLKSGWGRGRENPFGIQGKDL